MNMFEKATRTKARFPSARGDLTVEQLWEVPLRSRDTFNLNSIAQAVNAKVKEAGEESFVDTSSNPNLVKYLLLLDLVKHVIAVKKAEEEAALLRAANLQKKERLLEALAEKQNGKISALTEEELRKQIEELSNV